MFKVPTTPGFTKSANKFHIKLNLLKKTFVADIFCETRSTIGIISEEIVGRTYWHSLCVFFSIQ